jgi:hypothetical protein
MVGLEPAPVICVAELAVVAATVVLGPMGVKGAMFMGFPLQG